MASDRTRELANQIAQIPVELNGIKWSSKARVTTLKHDHEKIVALLDTFERETQRDLEFERQCFKALNEKYMAALQYVCDNTPSAEWLKGFNAVALSPAAQPTPEVKK